MDNFPFGTIGSYRLSAFHPFEVDMSINEQWAVIGCALPC